MYFYKKQGKQHLDLRGDFILSRNDALVKTRSKSAAPTQVRNGTYILKVGTVRMRATVAALRFIWSRA